MQEIFPKQPFIERLEFVGSLHQGERSADGLHFVLQYSEIKEGDISGCILGTTETFKDLSRVLRFPGPTIQMRSVGQDQSDTIIRSEHVFPGQIINKPLYGSEMSFKVADLRFHDLTIERNLVPRDQKERDVSFFLTGPSTLWTVYERGEKSFTGEETVDIKDSRIELDEALPFDIEVKPWYFYDKTSPPESFDLKTKVMVLNFQTKLPISDLTNEEFVRAATEVAEDLILLISFLSRRWLTWYSYELHTAEVLQTYVRETRKCSPKPIDHDKSVVSFHLARPFLRSGFTNLRKLRQQNIDLHMPLVYFVSGVEAQYVEEQFSILFLALERVKDLFAIHNGLQSNLAAKEFKRLRSHLSLLIESKVSGYNVENVLRKLPELNRPPLRVVLDAVFEKYGIDWKDLYPPDSDFTLLRTRDSLFHSSAEVDYDILIKDLHRLQALVERLILSMLGWSDFSNTPILHERQWLSSNDP